MPVPLTDEPLASVTSPCAVSSIVPELSPETSRTPWLVIAPSLVSAISPPFRMYPFGSTKSPRALSLPVEVMVMSPAFFTVM